MTLIVQENVSLSPLTTLKIGGLARYFIRADTESQVAEALQFAKSNDFRLFVLGGGSNVLISDNGFNGVVLQIAIRGGLDFSPVQEPESPQGKLRSEIVNAKTLITVGAGEDWDVFVAFCVKNDLAGVECLSGIPGFVGGTPVQNVGAYGQEVAETIVAVRCFDRKTREIITLNNHDCGFTYRSSIFNSTHRDRFIVVSVTFALHEGGNAKIVYKDLIERFGGSPPSISSVRDAVLKIRREKSMVIDPNDPNSKSVGSFFKNPVVDREKLDEIRLKFNAVPHFDFGEKVKIPAAWLIENAGFKKGFELGKAGISSNHTLALINRGGASATEILVLKEKIYRAVISKFGIYLEPEPVFVGF